VFKIGQYSGLKELESKFIVNEEKMLEFLEPTRLTYQFIENHRDLLDSSW
jgi:hypothetical protein